MSVADTASAQLPMLMRIATILAPMVAIVLAGYAYGRFRRPNMTVANQVAMEVFIPALVIATLADKSFELGAYVPMMVGGAVVILCSGRLLAWPDARA
jgi:predicted permease